MALTMPRQTVGVYLVNKSCGLMALFSPFSNPAVFNTPRSIGVIAFLLLCDERPFKGKNKKEVAENIKRCNYKFTSPAWGFVSQDAKDFVSSLLVYDQEERLSAEAALQHSWFNKTQLATSQRKRSSQHLLEDVRDNILAYARASELKKIAAVVIAHKSSSAEILDMRRAFDKYDKTKTGAISMEDFKLALAEFNYTDEELIDMFRKMVSNVSFSLCFLITRWYWRYLLCTLTFRGNCGRMSIKMVKYYTLNS